MQPNVAVWVDENRCKACNICVSLCPSGAIAMRDEVGAINGTMIEVIQPNSCIGCRKCEDSCPDFAIFVAQDGFKFAKLTQISKQRAQQIKANSFKKPLDCKNGLNSSNLRRNFKENLCES